VFGVCVNGKAADRNFGGLRYQLFLLIHQFKRASLSPKWGKKSNKIQKRGGQP
jgi:hypothetical protein